VISPPLRNEGRYFEDFRLGDVFSHPLGRTVSETDNQWFTLLTMNTNELHFNAHFAARSEYQRELVNSGLTLAMVLGLSVSDISQNAIANLSFDEIRLVAPVFVGDTLYAESVITGLRESASRQHAGIVSCFTRGLNQDGTEVLNYRRSVMVLKGEAGRPVRRAPECAVPIHIRAAEGSPVPRHTEAVMKPS
jgi:itaconyl-CoA hydratase